jgi:hypothetical protein
MLGTEKAHLPVENGLGEGGDKLIP